MTRDEAIRKLGGIGWAPREAGNHIDSLVALGLMKLDEPMLDVKMTVIGNCGVEHASMQEWQECRACGRPAPRRAPTIEQEVVDALESWWRPWANIYRHLRDMGFVVARDVPEDTAMSGDIAAWLDRNHFKIVRA